MIIETASRTHVGLRRKVNEDSMLVRDDCRLWAVADGMGGHQAGDVASSMVTQALGRLEPADDPEMLADRAVQALKRVNDELIALAGGVDGSRSIGTTVVGLVLGEGRFRCFWAGDSRAYRLRGGQIVQLTRDHSMVQDLVDAGMLQPEEAAGHPNSNIITRAVGVAPDLRVDIVRDDAMTGDLFLLASDGLTRMVDDRELEAELASSPPAEAAERLVDMVLARGAPDNVTLVIVKLD